MNENNHEQVTEEEAENEEEPLDVEPLEAVHSNGITSNGITSNGSSEKMRSESSSGAPANGDFFGAFDSREDSVTGETKTLVTLEEMTLGTSNEAIKKDTTTAAVAETESDKAEEAFDTAVGAVVAMNVSETVPACMQEAIKSGDPDDIFSSHCTNNANSSTRSKMADEELATIIRGEEIQQNGMIEAFMASNIVDEMKEYAQGSMKNNIREDIGKHEQVGEEEKLGNNLYDLGDLDSDPDYDYLGDDLEDSSMPDYEHLGDNDDNAIEEVKHSSDDYGTGVAASADINESGEHTHPTHSTEPSYLNDCQDVEEMEYYLGTLMVRVLQAKNLKANNQGGITSFIFDRRSRHRMSPGGGSSPWNSCQPYAKLSFRGQVQRTSAALDPSIGGSSGVTGGSTNYYWSRGEQSYFDVTCPWFANQSKHHPQSESAKKDNHSAKGSSDDSSQNIKKLSPRKEYYSRNPPPQIILFTFYYTKNLVKPGKPSKLSKKSSSCSDEDSDDIPIGTCSINVLPLLTGKSAYFDEWCTLHEIGGHENEGHVGRVRIVMEYEPIDPPPRPGDCCSFSTFCPFGELYPVPSLAVYSKSNTSNDISSSSISSVNNNTSGGCLTRPKQFRVEEVVGDHVILSYLTPEQWLCTFEVHRYLLICTHRHSSTIETYLQHYRQHREHIFDIYDNLSQSPLVETVSKTVERVPDDGLVYVGTEAIGGGVALLGRWWKNGVGGVVEDVVNVTNFDGRYSQILEDDQDEDDEAQSPRPSMSPTVAQQKLPPQEEKSPQKQPPSPKALPGMPSCPITGLPMIEPVVAADGHTYERSAIARWLETSDRSPLTGGVLGHRNLVPNYLLLSSVSGKVK